MGSRSPAVRRTALAAAVGLLAAGSALVAQPPAGPDAKSAADLRPQEERNADLFRKFQRELLSLAQKLERSDRPEDKDRAKVIHAALDLSRKEGVDTQFQKLIAGLGRGTGNVQELNALAGQDAQLTKALQDILTVLLTDDEGARLKAEIARLEAFLKEAREIKRNQETVRALTEGKRADADRLAKSQQDLADRTKELGDRMGGPKKAGDPKSGDTKGGKPGDPKDGDSKDGKPKDGKPKDGKSEGDAGQPGDPKDGKPKPGGKSGGPPPPPGGQPQDGGQPSPPQPQNQTPGRKQVQEAYPHQRDATEDLKKNDRQKAGPKEDKAIEELAKAIQELEKRLKQLREEEALKLLANLEARCNRMLAMQVEVLEATKAIDGIVVKNGGQKGTPEVQKAQQQADKEAEIVAEADKALKLLESEGSAVAFAKVLEEVRQDMLAVQRRLNAAVVGRDTQEIEENIISLLREMVAALKKAQQEMRQNQQSPPPGGKPADQKLIDLLAELKLIRARQVQVNTRTRMYGEKSPGEQASDPLLQAELRQLAASQAKLQEMVTKIATGANQ